MGLFLLLNLAGFKVQNITILNNVFLSFLEILASQINDRITFPPAFTAASLPRAFKSSNDMTSAMIKAFSKSEWMTPAACGALVFLRIVQARTSSGPPVKTTVKNQNDYSIEGKEHCIQQQRFLAKQKQLELVPRIWLANL